MNYKLATCKKTRFMILLFMLIAPCYAIASSVYHSNLNNQTKLYAGDGKGYLLEQSFIWGKKCVSNQGKKRLAPGETTVLQINKGCTWAGIKYNVIKNGVSIGSLSHSFRDKKFYIEFSALCENNVCNVTELPSVAKKAVVKSK
ncbi:MAG: hypothetical protein PSV35_10640 [bacterium]|nr:hypothetical protein [bacterium]